MSIRQYIYIYVIIEIRPIHTYRSSNYMHIACLLVGFYERTGIHFPYFCIVGTSRCIYIYTQNICGCGTKWGEGDVRSMNDDVYGSFGLLSARKGGVFCPSLIFDVSSFICISLWSDLLLATASFSLFTKPTYVYLLKYCTALYV